MATFITQYDWYYYGTNTAKKYNSSASSLCKESSDLMTSVGEWLGDVCLSNRQSQKPIVYISCLYRHVPNASCTDQYERPGPDDVWIHQCAVTSKL